MSIKMNELAQETRVKFQEAIADGRITADEWKNFSKEEQELLSKGLGGKTPTVGDDIVIKTNKKAPETKQKRAELSWGEIGKQGLKSVGNFFKSMVCDEEGFSIARTATTIGTAVAFAAVATVSAPVALAAGAALGAYMVYDGGKKAIEGTKEYYNAKTHEEAVAAMEKAMDGGVETAGGVAALFGVRKGYTKMKAAKAQPKAVAETQAKQTISEPKLTEPKPKVETFEVDGVSMKKTTFYDKYHQVSNAQGRSVKALGQGFETNLNHRNYPGMKIKITEYENGKTIVETVNLATGKKTTVQSEYAAELLRQSANNEDMGLLFRFINSGADYSSYASIFKKH